MRRRCAGLPWQRRFNDVLSKFPSSSRFSSVLAPQLAPQDFSV